jgi:tetratricopeptide (TPR) repeat protein
MAQDSLKFILKADFYLADEQKDIARQNLDSIKHKNYYAHFVVGKVYYQYSKYKLAISALKLSNKKKAHFSDFEIAKCFAKLEQNDSVTYYLKQHLKSIYKKKSNKIEQELDFESYRKSDEWKSLDLKKYYSKEEEAIERAIYYKEKGELTLALDILDELLINNKKLTEAYYYRAMFIILLNEDYKYAISDLKKAIKIENSNYKYLHLLAELYHHERKYKSALEFFTKAHLVNPYVLQDYYHLSKANYRAGNYDEAIKFINQYLDVSFRNIDALKLAGQIYYDNKDYKESIDILTQAIYINPRRIDILVARGNSYLDSDDYQRAGMDFNIALDLDPKNGELWYLKGLAYMYQDRMKYACQYFTKASYLNYYKANEYILKECQ